MDPSQLNWITGYIWGIADDGLRVDLLINESLVVELKSVEKLAPVHSKQVLTYLRLLDLPLGLLINFGAPTFIEGCKRIVNNHQNMQSSRLRINQEVGPGEDANQAKLEGKHDR